MTLFIPWCHFILSGTLSCFHPLKMAHRQAHKHTCTHAHTHAQPRTHTQEKWTVYTVYIYMMPVQKIKASKDLWRTETYLWIIYWWIGTVCYYWYVSMHGHSITIVKVIVNDTDEAGNKMSHPDVTLYHRNIRQSIRGDLKVLCKEKSWSSGEVSQGRKWTGVCFIFVTFSLLSFTT